MKYYVIVYLFFSVCSNLNASVIRLVQADKTFLVNITDKEAAAVFDDSELGEKHKVESLVLKAGDTIMFANRDEVNHNVSGWLKDKNIFDVKLQAPGSANDRSIQLKNKGEYIIQCAIHPKMKIKLKVE